MTNIFEYASRKKLRFASSKGSLTVEQLWNVPVSSSTGFSLSAIATPYYEKREKASSLSGSLLRASEGLSEDDRVSLSILEHIAQVLDQERKAAVAAAVKSSRKADLLDALAAREADALTRKTPEELRKMIEELG